MGSEGVPAVTIQEKMLLDNALDALDRLFDGHSSTIDVSALLFATSEALRGTKHHTELERAVQGLHQIIRSGGTVDVQREKALNATDDLRKYLADLL